MMTSTRLKSSCGSKVQTATYELIGLYDVVARMMSLALQYGAFG
jgi:hypothetical protein